MGKKEMEAALAPLPELQRQMFMRTVGDFHMTYMFSQGSPAFQKDIHKVLAHIYRKQWNRREFEAFSTLPVRGVCAAAVAMLALPKEHTPNISKNTAESFQQEWWIFRTAIAGKTEPYKERLAAFAGGMVRRDILYMGLEDNAHAAGRPGRRGGDPYQSFFRDYILRQGRVESRVFTTALRDTAALYQSRRSAPPAKLMSLSNQWDQRHPGECFFDGTTLLPAVRDDHRRFHEQ